MQYMETKYGWFQCSGMFLLSMTQQNYILQLLNQFRNIATFIYYELKFL